jgi:hypothetical protein
MPISSKCQPLPATIMQRLVEKQTGPLKTRFAGKELQSEKKMA